MVKRKKETMIYNTKKTQNQRWGNAHHTEKPGVNSGAPEW